MQRTSGVLDAAMWGRAYLAATLLSGGAKRGAAALQEATRHIDPDTVTETELILAAARAALGSAADPLTPEIPPGLPAELEQVLGLPRELRRSFVLRFLLGWSDEDCMAAHVPDMRSSAAAAALHLALANKTDLVAAA